MMRSTLLLARFLPLSLLALAALVPACSSSSQTSASGGSDGGGPDQGDDSGGTAPMGDDGGADSGAVLDAGGGAHHDSGSGTDAAGAEAGAAAVPSDKSGTTAMRIADLMEIFGANVYSDGQDGASGDTVAGITAAAKYLLGDSGLTMLFRGYVDSASEYSTFGPAVFSGTGCKFTLCMGIGNNPDPSGVISLAQASVNQGGWVAFVEGGNEPNTNFGASYQTGVAPDAELAAMQKIYAAVHPLGIPVAGPSVVGD